LESGSPNDSQKRAGQYAQRAGSKESAPPFEQMQKMLNEFIEQLKDLEWSECLAKLGKKIEADKVKIIVNDIKTEQAEAREAADHKQIETEKEIKAEERLQRKCEYVRGLCELTVKHKKGSPEAIEAAKKVLELLPKIERGDCSLWREMKDALFILSEALLADNEEAKAETDIVTLDSMRKIELIDDFCNWTDELIAYIKHPDKSREISKSNADNIGRQINNLAKKIWPHINSDQSDQPYQSTDIPEYENLHSGSIFSVQPELKERIIKRLQQWKDRALEDKSNLQKELKMQRKQATQQVGSQKEDGQGKTEKPGYEALKLSKVSVSKLIECGEGHNVEFKETLEYDVKLNRHNPNLNKECLRTIAAFLNTDGGTLLIGVKDNGEVTGIDQDLQYVQRKNRDGFELKLRSLMRNRFAPFPSGKVKLNFEKLAKGTVCRIDVDQASLNQIIHLDNEVYIRDGNMTVKLTGRDLTDWIQQRSQAGNTTAENENKQALNGWGLRPVFPQNNVEYHKPEVVGHTEEQLLTQLYYDYARWLEDVKRVCKSSGKSLEQYLREGLGLSIKDKRVRDCSYETALGLLEGSGKGQYVLHFFVIKCPHARDALLRGELPPYPWRNGPADLVKQPATPGTSKPKVQPARDQVFISYSHKDKRWFDDLLTHLKPLVRSGSITAWSDEQIEPGSKWFSEIKAALASTKVAVLLVTPNFLASDFIHEHELTPLMKEAEKGNVRVIWIPVRACLYKETPLKDDQAAIDPTKPLANMKAERDKAWVTICEEIKKTVNC